MGALAWSIAEPAPLERRRHQRVKVRLAGRFMRSDRLEFDCELIDASPGGIAFSSEAGVQPGERIVAYLNQIGRIEGRVARTFPTGFAVQMTLPPAKREKLADQLTWLANRQSLGLPEDRRHERIAPRDRYTMLRLANGREFTASLIDISISGAALRVDFQPPLGARVVIGSTQAQVVRHLDFGIAVEFMRPFPRRRLQRRHDALTQARVSVRVRIDPFQSLCEAAPILDIVGGGEAEGRDRALLQRPDRLGGRAHDEGKVVEALVLGHQRAGADQRAAADSGAVENDRAHADQRSLADRAAVQDDVMADGAVLADRKRRTHVGVQGAGFLDVRARADDDRLVIAA